MKTKYKSILRFELKQFFRSRTFWLLNLLFLLTGAYAAFYGRQEVRSQQANIDLLKQAIDSTTQITAAKFSHQDTIASWHYDDWLYTLHSNRPYALAGLAFGQRDLHKYATSIAIGTYYYNRYAGGYENKTLSGEIYNPQKQATGHLDISYVLVFLLPLYLIIISYNLLSRDREQGTLDLLLIQGVILRELLLLKLGLRAMLAIGMGWLLLLIAVVVNSAFDVRSGYFFLGTAGYVLCWTAIIALVSAFFRSSGTNALTLISVWLLFCLVLPAIFTAGMDVLYPQRTRADLTAAVQQANARVFNTGRRDLSIRFYRAYPRYNVVPRDTFPGGWYNPRWMRAVHLLLDDEVRPFEKRYQQQVKDRISFAQHLDYLSPALLAQSIFNRAAASDQGQMFAYDNSIYDHFARWRDFIDLRTYLKDDRLTREDFRQLPRTDFEPVIDGGRSPGDYWRYMS